MNWLKLSCVFLLPLALVICEISRLEVDPRDFPVIHSQEFKGSDNEVFNFIINTHILEKVSIFRTWNFYSYIYSFSVSRFMSTITE